MEYELIWLDPEEEKRVDHFDDGGWYWNNIQLDGLFAGPFDTKKEAEEWLSKIL